MKNKIIIGVAFILTLISICIMTSCDVSAYNRTFFDTSYDFDYAWIKKADGSIVEGEVDSWLDFENSDQIQVEINGETYLVHMSNVTLVDRKD